MGLLLHWLRNRWWHNFVGVALMTIGAVIGTRVGAVLFFVGTAIVIAKPLWTLVNIPRDIHRVRRVRAARLAIAENEIASGNRGRPLEEVLGELDR